MAITLIVLVAILMVFACFLWFVSPGKTRPIPDANGNTPLNSISEKIFVNINGVEQGMFLRSADTAHPVLLYLHGGPAMPTYFLEQQYPTGLETHFTICWWEQRGAGISYSADIPPETMTVQQMIADTVAVTDYLRNRFGKEKIYLMGHSWGSFIGIQAAAQAPDRYHAYIGVGQVTHQIESERLAYEYMLNTFRAQANASMLQKLETASFEMTVPLPASYMAVRDAAMHALGVGTTRQMRSVISGVFVPVWMDREYTLREKINFWRGNGSRHSSQLWNQVLMADVTVRVSKLDVPVYFLHGRYDYTVSYVLAKAYLVQLEAPLKGFYTFEDSAHSPQFEEPERTRTILTKDVLMGTTTLGDTTMRLQRKGLNHSGTGSLG